MGSEIQHAVMDFQHAVTVISMCCWSLELPPTKGNQPFSKWWTPPEIGRTYLKDAPQVAQSEANKLQNTKTQVENAVEQRKKVFRNRKATSQTPEEAIESNRIS